MSPPWCAQHLRDHSQVCDSFGTGLNVTYLILTMYFLRANIPQTLSCSSHVSFCCDSYNSTKIRNSYYYDAPEMLCFGKWLNMISCVDIFFFLPSEKLTSVSSNCLTTNLTIIELLWQNLK